MSSSDSIDRKLHVDVTRGFIFSLLNSFSKLVEKLPKNRVEVVNSALNGTLNKSNSVI